jgi:hypothetical protein
MTSRACSSRPAISPLDGATILFQPLVACSWHPTLTRINVAVEHDPLVLVAGVVAEVAEGHGHQALLPLARLDGNGEW